MVSQLTNLWVKKLYYIYGGTAGSIVLKNGGGGTTLLDIPVPHPMAGDTWVNNHTRRRIKA